MIVIDYIFSVSTGIIFLPYLCNLFIKKHNLFYYAIYGFIIDIMFFDKFLINMLFISFYGFIKKKKVYGFIYYLVLINLIIFINILLSGQFTYYLSVNYLVSMIINSIYYVLSNNKAFKLI